MRIAFLGSPEFACPTLDRLRDCPDCELVVVVSQPDRPAGRGRGLRRPAVAVRADALGVPLLQPQTTRDDDFLRAFSEHRPELAIVVAYGEIFREPLLASAPGGFYNLHASLLPRHRGPSPITAAILAGDAETGVSLFRLVRRMDAGPVLAERRTPIGPDETAGALHDRLAQLGAELVVDGVARLAAGDVTLVEQDEDAATYCHLLTKADGRLDWSQPAARLSRTIRAMTPWPGAQATLTLADGSSRQLLLRGAVPVPGQAAPGTVLDAGPEGLVVAAGEGALRLTRVLPAGRREMDAGAYLRGHPVGAGARFTSP